MNLAQIIDSYVSHQRSFGMRFDSSAKLLRSFQRAIGNPSRARPRNATSGSFAIASASSVATGRTSNRASMICGTASPSIGS